MPQCVLETRANTIYGSSCEDFLGSNGIASCMENETAGMYHCNLKIRSKCRRGESYDATFCGPYKWGLKGKS